MNDTKCSTCENSIFCSVWSEWKCLIRKERVYETITDDNCKDYKKRSAKGFKERPCHCEDCLREMSHLELKDDENIELR